MMLLGFAGLGFVGYRQTIGGPSLRRYEVADGATTHNFTLGSLLFLDLAPKGVRRLLNLPRAASAPQGSSRNWLRQPICNAL